MTEISQEAVRVLAGEAMLFRFGGKLVENEYLIKLDGGIYRRENAPDKLKWDWEQAEENARCLLDSDRLVPAIQAQVLAGVRERDANLRACAQNVVNAWDNPSPGSEKWKRLRQKIDYLREAL